MDEAGVCTSDDSEDVEMRVHSSPNKILSTFCALIVDIIFSDISVICKK